MASKNISRDDPNYLGPISASPQKVIEQMLNEVPVTKKDVVYDLGCNDGRVIITAARDRGASGYGVEVDEAACDKARRLAEIEGVSDKVQIICGDAMETHLFDATVVFLYLLPRGNKMLSEKLFKELRPGCKIVTYIFKLGDDWTPYMTKTVGISSSARVDNSNVSKLYVYTIPRRGKFRGIRKLLVMSTAAMAVAVAAKRLLNNK